MKDPWNELLIIALKNMANQWLLEESIPTPVDGVVPDWLINHQSGPNPELTDQHPNTLH